MLAQDRFCKETVAQDRVNIEAVLILAKQTLAQDRFSKELCKKQVCYGNTIRN